jgi:parallel beta-helix repeat protein
MAIIACTGTSHPGDRLGQAINRTGNFMIRHSLAIFLLSLVSLAQVTLHPTDNVPRIVSSRPEGTTFIFAPGIYRLSQSIIPKNNDQFIGQTSCAPPRNSCPAIISGAVVIGPLATFDGTNYQVTKQRQHGTRGATTSNCDPGWLRCIYPEDLFFDGTPLRHLDSPTLPTIGPGEWWFDYTNHTIYFHDDPSGHTVETSVLNNAFGGPANDVTIQHLMVEKFADMYPVGAIGATQGPNALTQETDWKVENCEVTLNHAMGVRLGYRIHVLNNYIHDNGAAGIGGGIGWRAAPSTQSTHAGILIQGNTINHNDYAHFDPLFGSGGIKIGSTTGIVVRGNTIQNNEGSGIHFDDDSGNVLVDGNTITDNSDADGLQHEIGVGTSIFRNNVVLRNGAQVNGKNWSFQIAVRVSPGADIYCNVLEVPSGQGVNAWGINATNRMSSSYPPYQYRTSTGNYVHHNTVIWDAGATGDAGFSFNDPENQPNFFANNKPPDYNTYHLPNTSTAQFVYDDDTSRSNKRKPFRAYQASGADVHSSVDTNYTSGYPTVSITAPSDQSSVGSSVMVKAAASDKSGIRKVEFYVDWSLQTTLANPPYDFNWTNGTTGSHTVAAMAYSNAGVRNCYAVTLNEQ